MNTTGLCQCGCGGTTRVAICDGGPYRVGEHRRFIGGHQNRREIHSTYRTIYREDQTDGEKPIYLHRHIAAKALGKPLPKGVEVHHVDGCRLNNSNCNLVICQDHSYHFLLHARTAIVKAGGNPDTERVCRKCGIVKALIEFSTASALKNIGRTNRCLACGRRYAFERAERGAIKFELGQSVEWCTRGSSGRYTRRGVVVEVIQAGGIPSRERFPRISGRLDAVPPRARESYVVMTTDGTAYWPHPGDLRCDDDGIMPIVGGETRKSKADGREV